MRNLKPLLFIIFSFFTNISYSQLKETFENGTIELKNGEKVNAYIKTDAVSKLTSKIYFKHLITDTKSLSYDTSQVKSFSTLPDNIFELQTVQINKRTKQISIFAKLIVKGKASLYKSYYDTDYFYIIVNKGVSYVLQNDKFQTGEMDITKFNYVGYLNIALEGNIEKDKSIKFNESDFIKLVSNYNTTNNYESKIYKENNKSVNFIIANVGYGFNNKDKELFLNVSDRIYFPQISRSTSLNIGINYYNCQFRDESLYSEYLSNNFTESLITTPFELRQNIFNKRFRPYVSVGFNLSYITVNDEKGYNIIEKGFQRNWGIGFLYGAGIEFDIYKGLMFKSEYRNEIYSHLINIGLSYNFSYKNK